MDGNGCDSLRIHDGISEDVCIKVIGREKKKRRLLFFFFMRTGVSGEDVTGL